MEDLEFDQKHFDEQKRRRSQFLRLLYRRTGGDTTMPCFHSVGVGTQKEGSQIEWEKPIGDLLGLSPHEVHPITQRLEAEGKIRFDDPDRTIISITPAGAMEVERESETSTPKDGEEDAPGEVFRHTADYTCVNLRGRQITLSPRQAEVIQLLHEACRNGTPDLQQDHIKERLKMGDSARVKGRFRSAPDAWKYLVTQGKRKGTLRLNI